MNDGWMDGNLIRGAESEKEEAPSRAMEVVGFSGDDDDDDDDERNGTRRLFVLLHPERSAKAVDVRSGKRFEGDATNVAREGAARGEIERPKVGKARVGVDGA